MSIPNYAGVYNSAWRVWHIDCEQDATGWGGSESNQVPVLR